MLLNRLFLRSLAALILGSFGSALVAVPAQAEGVVVAASVAVEPSCVGGNGAVDFTASLTDPFSSSTTFDVWAQYGSSPMVFLGSNWYDGERHGDIVSGTLFDSYGSNSPYDDFDTVTITAVDNSVGVLLTDPPVVIKRSDCGARPNRAPSAQNVTATMWQYDPSVVVTLQGSDLDVGDVLSYSLVSQPSYGTATGDGDQVTYTPTSTSFTGTDTFSYMVEDQSGESAQATVSVTVQPRVDFTPEAPTFTPVDLDVSEMATLSAPASDVVDYWFTELNPETPTDSSIIDGQTVSLSQGRAWHVEVRLQDGVHVNLTGQTVWDYLTPWMLRPQSDVQCYNGVCLDNNNAFDVWFRYQGGRVRVPAGVQDFKVRTSLAEAHWAMELQDGTVLQLGSTEVKQFRPTGSITYQCQGPRHRAIMRVNNGASTVPVEMTWTAPGVEGAGKAAPGKSWSRPLSVRPPGKVRVFVYWAGVDSFVKVIGPKPVPKACRR